MFKHALLAVMFLAAACGGDDGVGELESLVEKACACTDAACFKGYDDKLEDTAKKVLSKYKSESDMPESVGDKLKSLEAKFEACGEKLAAGGEPAGDPGAAKLDLDGAKEALESALSVICACPNRACFDSAVGELWRPITMPLTMQVDWRKEAPWLAELTDRREACERQLAD